MRSDFGKAGCLLPAFLVAAFLVAVAPAGLAAPAETFDLTPTAVPGLGFPQRRDTAVQVECMKEGNLRTPTLGEDGPVVAMAKLTNPDCGRFAHQPFEGSNAAVLLGNPELINKWLMSVTETGEVGTDLSGVAKAINSTIDTVLAAVAVSVFTGIPIPPPLDLLVGPTTALVAWLKLTQSSIHCQENYDYDMGLTGAVRLLYRFGQPGAAASPGGPLIESATYDHVLNDLLTQTGGINKWRDHTHLCGIAIPVPETENHIWMTESARYLTNQLLRGRLNPTKADAIDKQTGYVYVDDKNGMKHKLLDRLSKILIDDFHEYNARPYARLTAKALENLYDFAEDREVRRGARMALDYISAKFAVSSSASRRSVPYRRLTETEDATELYGLGIRDGELRAVASDEETFRFLLLSEAFSALTNDGSGKLPSERASGTMTVSGTSGYRVPDLINDLIENQDHRGDFFQRFRHEAYELYTGDAKFLISAGGVFRPGWERQFWDHVAIDAAVGAIVGNPILGPIIGETGVTGLINGIVEKNAASALPTTLMPAGHGTNRTDFIRIDGAADREKRNNTCVSGRGFACGLNPKIPDSVPAACQKKNGNWTFVNFSPTPAEPNPDCGRDYGYFVVFWSADCDDSDCVDHAGGETRYGFFEVVESSADNTFERIMRYVIDHNRGRMFPSRLQSVYSSPTGVDIAFTMDTPVDVWSMADDPWHIPDEKVGDMTTWRAARGSIVNNLFPKDSHGNDWRPACVEIDNSLKARRRILDFSEVDDPRWCEISTLGFIRYGCTHERCPPSDVD